MVKPIAPEELRRTLSAFAKEKISTGRAAVVAGAEVGPTSLRFWGVRGSIPTPGLETAKVGGNTSCVEVRFGDQIIILDAGSGIRNLGLSLMNEFKDKPLNITMLISHTHWDHIQGFPFFVPAYNPRVSVRILGYEGAVHGLRGALFEQMQSAFFPVGLNQMASHVTFEELGDMEFQLGAVNVRTIFANHPGICLGNRLCTPNGDIVYMPDHEGYERYEAERQKLAGENSAEAINYAREQDEKTVAFIRNAEVLIADSQYDGLEYPKRIGWGHTCADDTLDVAIRAGIKNLFLFHHDPDHHDEQVEAMASRAKERALARNSSISVDAAREGATFVLAAKPA